MLSAHLQKKQITGGFSVCVIVFSGMDGAGGDGVHWQM